MSKNVQMSIKMEAELHEQFMAVADSVHTPAAQVVRQLMRRFILLHEVPNAITVAAMQEAEKGLGTRYASSDDLFKDLEI